MILKDFEYAAPAVDTLHPGRHEWISMIQRERRRRSLQWSVHCARKGVALAWSTMVLHPAQSLYSYKKTTLRRSDILYRIRLHVVAMVCPTARQPPMAPKLPVSTHAGIRCMIENGGFKNQQIANRANCSRNAVKAIKRNLRECGSTTKPARRSGRPSSITPSMRHALLAHVDKHRELYLQEMVEWVREEFGVVVTKSSVSRTLHSAGRSKKKFRRQAAEQNPDLIDYYLHSISSFHSYQFVYVDESGCDTRDGLRRNGWSRRGETPVQTRKFPRGQRYQILPAYSHDGILFSRVYQGTTDAAVFEDFIEELLHHCGRFPAPRSVLVMDNASYHRSERIQQMCDAAGVKLLYLPPYSPRLNLIEEVFAELKAFIKKSWKIYEQNPEPGFGVFLEWCVDVVGRGEESARGHFRHAGWTIEEPGT